MNKDDFFFFFFFNENDYIATCDFCYASVHSAHKKCDCRNLGVVHLGKCFSVSAVQKKKNNAVEKIMRNPRRKFNLQSYQSGDLHVHLHATATPRGVPMRMPLERKGEGRGSKDVRCISRTRERIRPRSA